MFSRFFRKKEKSSPEIVVVHSTTAASREGRPESHATQVASVGTNQVNVQHLTSSSSTTAAVSPAGGGSFSSPAKTRLSFAAQFPPIDWRDPDYANYHSRSTQTLVNREQQTNHSPGNTISNNQQENDHHVLGTGDANDDRHANLAFHQQMVSTGHLHKNSVNNQQLQHIKHEVGPIFRKIQIRCTEMKVYIHYEVIKRTSCKT